MGSDDVAAATTARVLQDIECEPIVFLLLNYDRVIGWQSSNTVWQL